MTTIKLEIKNCSECPNWKETPYPTADSWERALKQEALLKLAAQNLQKLEMYHFQYLKLY